MIFSSAAIVPTLRLFSVVFQEINKIADVDVVAGTSDSNNLLFFDGVLYAIVLSFRGHHVIDAQQDPGIGLLPEL
ncbi:hypothetical protein DMB90_10250 [Raoultella planticola]|uniref:Uncharacterized protein n=1 Tax=Raoultella planticola TaxID=575 RepID=A0A5P6A9R3_RAOPL|nr:hypothetical protein DMB90_10250 [Raoultella planticola]